MSLYCDPFNKKSILKNRKFIDIYHRLPIFGTAVLILVRNICDNKCYVSEAVFELDHGKTSDNKLFFNIYNIPDEKTAHDINLNIYDVIGWRRFNSQANFDLIISNNKDIFLETLER